MMRYILIVAMLAGVAGGIIGWHLHPEPELDIFADPRGCVIQWDDGTYSYKSRTVHLGTLKPGESKTFSVN